LGDTDLPTTAQWQKLRCMITRAETEDLQKQLDKLPANHFARPLIEEEVKKREQDEAKRNLS